MKKGFTLLIAILFLIFLLSISLSVMTLNSTAISSTQTLYLRAQAKLMALWASEDAIYQIIHNDFSKRCPSEFELFYPQKQNFLLRSLVKVEYIGGKRPASCGAMWLAQDNSTGIKAAIMHTLVESNPNLNIQKIKIARTTTQKP